MRSRPCAPRQAPPRSRRSSGRSTRCACSPSTRPAIPGSARLRSRLSCARWMDERGALAATLVTRQGEACGVLVVPRGAGRAPVTLEEAHALKELSDAMSGACAAKSAFARSLQRERDATTRAEAAELDLERHRHAEALAHGRMALA